MLYDPNNPLLNIDPTLPAIPVEISDEAPARSHEYAAFNPILRENGILTLEISNNGERDFKAITDGKIDNEVIHIKLVHDNHGNYNEIGCSWLLKVDLNTLKKLYDSAVTPPTATLHCDTQKYEGIQLPSARS